MSENLVQWLDSSHISNIFSEERVALPSPSPTQQPSRIVHNLWAFFYKDIFPRFCVPECSGGRNCYSQTAPLMPHSKYPIFQPLFPTDIYKIFEILQLWCSGGRNCSSPFAFLPPKLLLPPCPPPTNSLPRLSHKRLTPLFKTSDTTSHSCFVCETCRTRGKTTCLHYTEKGDDAMLIKNVSYLKITPLQLFKTSDSTSDSCFVCETCWTRAKDNMATLREEGLCILKMFH